MIRRWISPVFIACLLMASHALGARVGGTVKDGTSDLPVPGAYVEIFYFSDAESMYVATGFTDSQGVYLFDGIPEGVYFANAWSSGYATTRFYNVQISAGGLQLDVELFPPYVDAGGIIIGTDSGAVASALMVWTLTANAHEYQIVSDAQGRFSLTGLPSGGYQVNVSATGYQSCQFSTAVESGVAGYGVVLIPESPTSVDEDLPAPSGYALEEAYPNPFNPSTTIRYRLPAESRVRLEIADLTGAVVTVLADGLMPAGVHAAAWDARGAASGVYFCRLTIERATVLVNKLVLAK